jgi:hypothetical protein
MPPDKPRADEALLVSNLRAARDQWDICGQAFTQEVHPFLVTWLSRRLPGLSTEESEAAVSVTLKRFLSSGGLRDYRRSKGSLVAFLACRALADVERRELAVARDLPGEVDDTLVLGESGAAWIKKLWQSNQAWEAEVVTFGREYGRNVLAVLRSAWPTSPDVEDAVQLALTKFLRTRMENYNPAKRSLMNYILVPVKWELRTLLSRKGWPGKLHFIA